MRVLAFRHVPFEHLGLISGELERASISIEYVDLFRDPRLSSRLESTAGLVFMGGPMSANDDLPYLRTELDLIREAVGKGMPVLGICLGSQLIAKALGARVYRNAVKEIGWAPVYWTSTALNDPLFRGFRVLRPSSTGTGRPSTCPRARNGLPGPAVAAIRLSGTGAASMASSFTWK